ncbi:MAG: ABC transporter ATP-binding protein [Planctomycetota bacterium]
MAPLTPPLVNVQGLSRTYGHGATRVVALDGVNLSVDEGEVVAIVGRSGSGKSTLVNLLGGLDHSDAGTVEVAGQSLHALGSNELATYRRRTVGMIFQSFNLVSTLTAEANVELPLVFDGWSRADRRLRAAELLERVGLTGRATHLPSELSGGEQQRVAIARALALKPPFLLADEPTGNLDSTTARGVMELLLAARENRRRTVLLVTHDLALAEEVSDRVIHLADGRIAS